MGEAPGVLAVLAHGDEDGDKAGWDLGSHRVAASQKNAVVQPRGEVRGEPENWFGRMF